MSMNIEAALKMLKSMEKEYQSNRQPSSYVRYWELETILKALQSPLAEKEECKHEYWHCGNEQGSCVKCGFKPSPQTTGNAESLADKCGICGSKQVYIRGQYPGHDNRLICPTCAYERLEQINSISSKEYGIGQSSVLGG